MSARSEAITTGEEHSQARHRFSVVVVFALAVTAMTLFNLQPSSPNWLICLVGYVLFCLSSLFHTRKFPKFSAGRVTASLLLDQLFMALLFWSMGMSGAPFILSSAIASIGYGARYGRKYAYRSAFAATSLISAAMWFSEYWRGVPLNALGVVLCSFYLPIYSATITQRLRKDNRFMKRRASDLTSAREVADRARIDAEKKMRLDSLTGLLNRVGFDEVVEEMLAHHLQTNENCALLILDLDGFKGINDTCGHAAGDEILKRVGNVLNSEVRPSFACARYGGDEFAIAVNQFTDAAEVKLLARHVLAAIGEIEVPTNLPLGASVGICFLPGPYLDSKRSVFNVADKLMYAAKRAGKNRCVASDEMPSLAPAELAA